MELSVLEGPWKKKKVVVLNAYPFDPEAAIYFPIVRYDALLILGSSLPIVSVNMATLTK